MRNEEKNYVTVALRLYLSGTSRKDTWSSKVRLVSVCLVLVSVFLSFCSLFFGSFLVSGVLFLAWGEGGSRVQKSSLSLLHSLFYNGECLWFHICVRQVLNLESESRMFGNCLDVSGPTGYR